VRSGGLTVYRGLATTVALCGLAVAFTGCSSPLRRVADRPTPLLRAPEGFHWNSRPQWSSDGSHLLATLAPIPGPQTPAWRDPKHLYVLDVASGSARRLGQCVATPRPQFTPDGQHILLDPGSYNTGALAYRDISTGRDELLYRSGRTVSLLTASHPPQGRPIAVCGSDDRLIYDSSVGPMSICLIDPVTHASRVVARPKMGCLGAYWSSRAELAWIDESPDGKPEVVVARPPYYSITRIAVPAPTSDIGGHPWSPDGTRLLVVAGGARPIEPPDMPLVLLSVDVDTGQSTEVLRLPAFGYDPGLQLCWSPDASLIAVGALRLTKTEARGFVVFHSLSSQRLDDVKIIGPFTDGPSGLTWSPKGDAVAFARESEIDLIRVRPEDG